MAHHHGIVRVYGYLHVICLLGSGYGSAAPPARLF